MGTHHSSIMLTGVFMLILSLYFIFTNQMWIMEYSIISSKGTNMSFYILLDWMNSMFLSIVSMISYSVFMFSKEYMPNHIGWFANSLAMFVLSMVLSVISPNLLSILLGWDLLGLTSFCLIIFYPSGQAYRSGSLTLMSNRIGDMTILLSLPICLSTWVFLEEHSSIQLLVLMAGLTKSAQIPFSAWLPAASEAPTPVSALVHSSTLVTAGVYLLIRFYPLFEGLLQLLSIISVLTLMMAGLAACQEMDIKKIVAYSTLSQLGLMMFGLSKGSINEVFFHLLLHAFFKALMFLAVGALIFYTVQDYRMISKFNYLIIHVGLMISIMCLMGLTFSSGYYSKDMSLDMMMITPQEPIITSMFMSGLMLTMLYSFRLMKGALSSIHSTTSLSPNIKSLLITKSISFLSILALGGGAMLQWVFPLPPVVFIPMGSVLLLSLLIPILSNTAPGSGNMSFHMKWLPDSVDEYQLEEVIPSNYSWLWIEKEHIYIVMLWFCLL